MSFWNSPRHPFRLLLGASILMWTLIGRYLSPRLWLRTRARDFRQQTPREVVRIPRPDGSSLHVELYGPPDGVPLVLTHGCGGDGAEWHYIKTDFADRYRLIIWDLPGMGGSGQPDNRDFSMEKLARDLNAVLDLAEARPAILIGHSTGGMIILTFCRLFPERLRAGVAGIVLAHTTASNPALSMCPTRLWRHLQKPLLEPMCQGAVMAAPFVSVLFKIGYQCGLAHWLLHLQMFAGTQTRRQLDFAARYVLKAPVSAIARTTLAMFHYDETEILPTIPVPVLVVSGDRDLTTAPEASEHIARSVPHGELVVLSPARHFGIIERNEEFSQILQRFLDNLERTGAPADRGTGLVQAVPTK